jgi:putative sigma-54 modulation protein
MAGAWVPAGYHSLSSWLVGQLEQRSQIVQIIVTGRHLDVTDELKAHVTQKLEKLTRFYDRIESIEAVLDREHEVPIVETLVNAERGVRFVARESSTDLYAALDLVMDKLSRQLTKHKEQFRNRKHQPKRPDKTLEP